MFNHAYSPTVVHTWIQLRGFAWDRSETPQLSMNQLSEITGKSPSTLYGHMALLRSWGALRMRNSEKGTFILSFPADTGEFFLKGDSLPDHTGSIFPDSRNLEKPDPPLNPPVNQIDDLSLKDHEKSLEEFNHQDKISEDQREGFTPGGFKNKNLDHSRGGSVQISGQQSENLEQDSRKLGNPRYVPEGAEEFQNFGQQNNLPPDLEGAGPEKIYQSLTGIRPKKLQREHLQAQIQETNIWYASIEHWIFHGWNPKNITGMIDLYQRGGAPGCRYCSKEQDSQDETLSVIQKMREEYRSRNYGNY